MYWKSYPQQSDKGNKRHPNWKAKSELSLFEDDMILHIEKPKVSTKKPLELINEFSKDAGYKINRQNFVAFLYTNGELSETEIKKKSCFKSHQKD